MLHSGLADAPPRSDIFIIGAGAAGMSVAPRRMRKNEGISAGLLIVEALDEASLRHALRRTAEMAPDVVGDTGDAEVYQGMFALDARIADSG